MHTKQFFLITLLCIIFTSCKQNEQKIKIDLGDIRIIYCTPTDPAKCMPLEITQDIHGWEARYIGVSSNDTLRLEPSFSIDEDGDTLVTFREFLNDKLNGSYSFGYLSQHCYSNPYYEVTYSNAQGEKIVDFHACVIWYGDIFIDEKRTAYDFISMMHHYGNDPLGCGSLRRDQNLTYFFHTNPQTLTYSFNIDDDNTHFEVITSEDGQLRLFNYESYTGGNGMGAGYNTHTLQYKVNGKVVTLDQFHLILFNRLKDFQDSNFPNCHRLQLYQATLNEEKHYLIEATYFDPAPMPYEDGNGEIRKSSDLVLFAYTIKNGRLTPSPILDGQSMIELVNDDNCDNVHFRYDDTTKMLSIPQLDSKTHTFTGKYKTIRLSL